MKKFFENAAVKFQRFMYGRYGMDQLYRGLIWIYLALILLAVILGKAINHTAYSVVSAIAFVVFAFSVYRLFSKNIEKRRSENAKWLKFENGIKKRFRLIGDRWKFRKTHVFRKCPKCKAVLRLKKIKGKHNVCCPHCSESFKINVL